MAGRSTAVYGFIGGVPITPSDVADIPGGALRGYVVTVAGNVRATMADGSDVVWPAQQPGVDYARQCVKIWATNTTATGIVGGR